MSKEGIEVGFVGTNWVHTLQPWSQLLGLFERNTECLGPHGRGIWVTLVLPVCVCVCMCVCVCVCRWEEEKGREEGGGGGNGGKEGKKEEERVRQRKCSWTKCWYIAHSNHKECLFK